MADGLENKACGLELAGCGLTSIGVSNCELMSIGLDGLGTSDSPVGGVAVVVGSDVSGSGVNALATDVDSASPSDVTSGLTAAGREGSCGGKESSECAGFSAVQVEMASSSPT